MLQKLSISACKKVLLQRHLLLLPCRKVVHANALDIFASWKGSNFSAPNLLGIYKDCDASVQHTFTM